MHIIALSRNVAVTLKLYYYVYSIEKSLSGLL